MKHEQQKL